MNFFRQGIKYALGRLSIYSQCPNQEHWDTLESLKKYLGGKMNYVIEYSRYPVALEKYSDAKWISY